MYNTMYTHHNKVHINNKPRITQKVKKLISIVVLKKKKYTKMTTDGKEKRVKHVKWKKIIIQYNNIN